MTSWWQLAYTSADSNDGTPGGWGVKRANPPAARDRADAMLSGVDTRAFVGEELGDFPTAATLASRVRQLAARRLDGQLLVLHSVSAGADATGRPGNVFVHAALATSSERSDVTAIEYWRSTDWLTPFGPSAVSAAELPPEIGIGTAITRASIADFLAYPGRLETLAVLLECACPPTDGRPPVILLVDDADEAASWIGALTFARDPRSDADIAWTTWARAGALPTLVGAGFSLLAVSSQETEAAASWVRDTPEAVLVDPRAGFRLAPDGSSWLSTDSRRVAGVDTASGCMLALRAGVDEFGPDLLRDLLEDVPEAISGASADHANAMWALTAIALCDPDIRIDGREELTMAVLMEGPQEERPGVVTAAVDRWWQEDPSSALGALTDPTAFDDIRQLLLRRRVVLLLAGELAWDDVVDGRFGLDDDDRAHTQQETANAVKRLEALQSLGNRREEVAAMLRILDAYAVGLSAEELAVARDQLLAEADATDRPWLIEASTPPRRAPLRRRAEAPAAFDAKEVTPSTPSAPIDIPVSRSAPPLRTSPPPPPPPPEQPVQLAGSAAPAVAAALDAARPRVVRASAASRESRSQSVVREAIALCERWLMLMNMARSGSALDPSGWTDIEENLDKIHPSDLAQTMLTLDDPDLFAVLHEAMRVSLTPSADRTPFAIGRGANQSNSFLKDVAVEVFLRLRAPEADDVRAWSAAVWEQHVLNAKDKRLGKNPLLSPWQAATNELQRKGFGHA